MALGLALALGAACVYDVAAIRRQLFDYNESPSLKRERSLLDRIRTLDPPKLRECQDWGSVVEALDKYTSKFVARAAHGDSLALAFGFRALRFSDGAYAESLHVDLGAAIERHPRKFLAALKHEFGDSMCDPGLVGNLGDDFVDEKLQPKLVARRLALESVRDPNLEKLKRVCIANLAES